MFWKIVFVISLYFEWVLGENRVALESSKVDFLFKSVETPIWLEKTKDISMAYGTKKRSTFTNDRSET